MAEFEALLEKYQSSLRRFIAARVKNDADAEDLFQEICLSAFKGYLSLREESAFLPWLLGIARHQWADYQRKRYRNLEDLTDQVPEVPWDGACDDGVSETLQRLDEKDRIMLALFYRERMPQRLIAQALHIPEGTVKSRLHAARARFRSAYPDELNKGDRSMKKLPEKLPLYTIIEKKLPPFPVKWEEMMGWFIVPRLGETLTWGMYDLPSRKLDVGYDLRVTGKARVHGLEGVEIVARVIEPKAPLPENDIMREPAGDAGAREGDWRFVAQMQDGYTRFLSAERTEGGVKKLSTFLDPDFMDNWGFGENNRGNSVYLAPKGVIKRKDDKITYPEGRETLDAVGRYEVILDGKSYDTVCVMDVNAYLEDVVSEQYLDAEGRTVLWRRFNPNEWKKEKYGGAWAELLPENERIYVNGRLYVHWYDCLCIR